MYAMPWGQRPTSANLRGTVVNSIDIEEPPQPSSPTSTHLRGTLNRVADEMARQDQAMHTAETYMLTPTQPDHIDPEDRGFLEGLEGQTVEHRLKALEQ